MTFAQGAPRFGRALIRAGAALALAATLPLFAGPPAAADELAAQIVENFRDARQINIDSADSARSVAYLGDNRFVIATHSVVNETGAPQIWILEADDRLEGPFNLPAPQYAGEGPVGARIDRLIPYKNGVIGLGRVVVDQKFEGWLFWLDIDQRSYRASRRNENPPEVDSVSFYDGVILSGDRLMVVGRAETDDRSSVLGVSAVFNADSLSRFGPVKALASGAAKGAFQAVGVDAGGAPYALGWREASDGADRTWLARLTQNGDLAQSSFPVRDPSIGLRLVRSGRRLMALGQTEGRAYRAEVVGDGFNDYVRAGSALGALSRVGASSFDGGLIAVSSQSSRASSGAAVISAGLENQPRAELTVGCRNAYAWDLAIAPTSRAVMALECPSLGVARLVATRPIERRDTLSSLLSRSGARGDADLSTSREGVIFVSVASEDQCGATIADPSGDVLAATAAIAGRPGYAEVDAPPGRFKLSWRCSGGGRAAVNVKFGERRPAPDPEAVAREASLGDPYRRRVDEALAAIGLQTPNTEAAGQDVTAELRRRGLIKAFQLANDLGPTGHLGARGRGLLAEKVAEAARSRARAAADLTPTAGERADDIERIELFRGEFLTGRWVGDTFHAEKISDGVVYRGEWRMSDFGSLSATGYGVMRFGGFTYSGQFTNGRAGPFGVASNGRRGEVVARDGQQVFLSENAAPWGEALQKSF